MAKAPYKTKQMTEILTFLKSVQGRHVTVNEICDFFREKGISIYACDTPIEDADVPYIGIDNEKLGYELGEKLAEALDHKGKIGVIAGDRRFEQCLF